MDIDAVGGALEAAAVPLLRLHRYLEGEHRRRRLSEEAYAFGKARWRDLREAADGWMRPHRDLVAEIEEVETQVRAMPRPPAPTPPPPLPTGEVGVGEVLVLLRRILNGEAEAAMAGPPARWPDVYHAAGEIHADGWILHLYRRGEGLRYVERVESPDGRRSDCERMLAREGEPSDLLEDDEFDALGRLLDGLDADGEATRTSLMRAKAQGDAWGVRRAAGSWLTIKGAPDAATPELRLAALQDRGGDLSAADLEFLWDLEDMLRQHPAPKASAP